MAERRTRKRRACVPCTRAKRACDRQTPSCARCNAKDLVCRYPAPRIIYVEGGACSTVPAASAPTDSQVSREYEEPSLEAPNDTSLPELSEPLPSSLFSASADAPDPWSAVPWYLTPSSWELAYSPRNECLTFGEDNLKSFVGSLQAWMKQWTSQGHCAFIHRSLYSSNIPLAIQDAFTTLTAYQAKTPTTEKMVLHICKDRFNNIIQNQPLDSVDGVTLDTAMHLARTQALIVYITICLFDGDINARAQAEQGLEVLLPWGHQLLQSASLDTFINASWNTLPGGSTVPEEPATFNNLPLSTANNSESVWSTWVFAESIRRTYLIVVLLVTIYSTLKTGWSGCPGGVTFTGDKGLWDAPSAYAWETTMRAVKERTMGFMPIYSHRMTDVLANRKSADVDDFTHASLVVTLGHERIEWWKADASGS
ncbi:hypothetical protein ACHAPT_010300 [Fusarium lateritium]